MSLKLHEIKLIRAEDIKLDLDNPNVMTPEQMQALRESFKRFGYLEPIILDENLLVADGEHRLEIFREFGVSMIPCYVLKLSDVERRLLRQTKNKLRGEHGLIKDAEEMRIIIKAGMQGDLLSLIAMRNEEMTAMLLKSAQDFKPVNHGANLGDLAPKPERKCPSCGYIF